MRAIKFIAVFLCAVGVWWVCCVAFSIPPYLLPAPHLVFAEFVQDPGGLLTHFLQTLAEAFLGLVVAWVLATIAGSVLFVVKGLDDTLLPVVAGFKAVPLVVLAPLFVLWFGAGFLSKCVMSATICFFPILVGYVRGFRACSDDEVLFLKNLSLSRMQELVKFRLIKAAPFWLAGLRVASVLAVVGAIVAEFTGANKGLGYVLIVSSLRIETSLTMAGVILSAVCGMLLHGMATILETIVLRQLHMEQLPE